MKNKINDNMGENTIYNNIGIRFFKYNNIQIY